MAVLVTNDFPPHHGGIQRCMSRIAQELTRRGECVTVVAPQLDGSADYDIGQQFRVLRYADGGRIGAFIAMTMSLFRARLSARDSYTVASMWFPGGVAACIIPRFMRGRLGILAHGTEIAPRRGGLRRYLMRYVFARADVIVANSTFTRELLAQAGVRKPVCVVHLGIDGEEIVPQRADVPTILSVGRLVRRKGFDKVIAAMPAVLEEFPDARYEIVGDGPQRAELAALAASLGVSHAVHFRGAIDDDAVRKAYASAWTFALPVRTIGSDVEGFGLVYLEAALASLPSVGGLRSGAEDAIVPGETGLLVDGDSQDAVSTALLTLLREPERAAQMGRAGKQRALHDFTWSLTAQRLSAIMTSG